MPHARSASSARPARSAGGARTTRTRRLGRAVGRRLGRPVAAVTALALAAGAVLVGIQPALAADPPGWTDMHLAKTVSKPSVAPLEQFAFVLTFDCFSNTSPCENATLVDTLPAGLVIDGVDPMSANVPATVAVDQGASTVTVTFTKALPSPSPAGTVGLIEGATGTVRILAHFADRALGDGDLTVTNTAVMSATNRAQITSSVDVSVEVSPVARATATKDWANAVSGPDGPTSPNEIVAAGADKSVTLGFTNASNFAVDSLAVREPAALGGAPAARSAFDVLALLGLTAADLTTVPAGATEVRVTPYLNGAAGTPVTSTLAGLDPATDLLGGAAPADVTGLLVELLGDLPVGASGAVTLRTEQRTAPLSGGAAAGTVSNDIAVVASGSPLGTLVTSAPAPAQDSFTLVDAHLQATTAKSAFSPSTIPVAGASSTVTISGTTTSNVPVSALRLTDPADGSTGFFTDAGLLFGGFGTDGGGSAGVSWPTGATSATVVFDLDGGTGTTATVTAAGTLPTLATPGAPASWDLVRGLTITFAGQIPTGQTATVPYVVVPGPGAAPTDAGHPAPVNCVVAEAEVAGTTSDPSASACRTLTLTAPKVAATVSKSLTSTTLSTAPGSRTTAVLTATPRIGTGAGNTGPTSLTVDEPAAGDPGAARWWQVFAPTRLASTPVAVGEQLTVRVTTTSGTTTYGPFAGPQVVSQDLADPEDTTGVELVYDRTDGASYTATSTVRANLTFEVRSAATGGGAFADAEVLTNCADVTAELATHPEATTTSAPACAQVTGIAFDGGGAGAAPLTKHTGDIVTEGTDGTPDGVVPVTLAWSTNGQDYTRVDVADQTDAAGTPVLGQASYFDAFDLTRIQPITSGPARSGTNAWDPYLVFDRITAVQIWDTTLATPAWRSLDLPVSCRPDGCLGSFPGLTLSAADSAAAGAVRLVYEPRTDRATVITNLVAAGDWRLAIAPTGTAAVAAVSAGDTAREVKLSTVLRAALRSEPTQLVNNARSYNVGACLTDTPTVPLATCAGKVADDAMVRGDAGSGLVPVGSGTAGNLESERTVAILPMALAVRGSKTWLRADAYTQTPHDLGLPVTGTDPDDYPTALLTVAVQNGTGAARVDELAVTEPATLAGDGSDPFDRFRVTTLATTAPAGTGVTTAVYLNTGSGLSTTAATPTQLADADLLADVVQVKVVFTGRIASQATGTLRLGTQLLAEIRGTSTPVGVTPAGDPVDNVAGLSAADGRVCTDSSGGGTGEDAYPCDLQPDTLLVDDALTISARSLEVQVAKDIAPASVNRDVDPATPVTATLRIQNVGNSTAESLTVTDAAQMPAADAVTGAQPADQDSATFYNAVDLTGVRVPALPTGATQVRLDVLTGSSFTAAGSDLTAAGGTWTTGDPVAAVAGQSLALPVGLPAGTGWSDVVGVRVVFLGSALPSPGAVGQVVLGAALRPVLRSGEAPSATNGVPAAMNDTVANPGETAVGTVTNVVTGRADATGLDSQVDVATDDLTVSAGSVGVTVGKSPTGQVMPGDGVDFHLTFTNSGTADLPDPVVTDHLATDASGQVFRLDPAETGLVAGSGDSPWSVTVTGGPDLLGAPEALRYNESGTATTIDGVLVPAHAVLIAWPDGAVLRPGQTVTVTLPLVVRSSAIGATTNRFSVATDSPTRYLTDATCLGQSGAPSTRSYDAGDRSCSATVPLTVAASGAFTSRKDVRAWPDDLGAVDTRAGSTATCAADPDGYVAYPCAALVQPGGLMRWRTSVTAGNVPGDSLVLVDVLPAQGDVGELTHIPRETDWRPTWTGETPVLDGAYPAGTAMTVLYATVDNPTPDYSGVPSATWSATAPADPADVTGFAFVLDFAGTADAQLPAGESVRMAWTMRAPHDLSADDWQGDLAWNTFGYTGQSDDTYVSQPRKAGVYLPQSAVTVTKSVDDATDYGVAASRYEATVSCTVPTDPTDPAGPRTALTLPDGGVVVLDQAHGWTGTVEGVPVGATCEVRETDAGGASDIRYAVGGAPATTTVPTIEVTATSTVQDRTVAIANTYQATSVTVRKVVPAADGAPAAQEYTFTLGCSFEGDTLALPAADVAFTLRAGQSRTLTGLPVGAECEAVETDAHGALIGYRLGSGSVVSTTGAVTLAADAGENLVTVENAFSVLDLAKDVDRTTTQGGERLTYTLGVTNTGDAPTSDVRLHDPLPADVRVLSTDAPSPWVCDLTGVAGDGYGGVLDCAYDGGAELAAGEHAPVVTLGVEVRPDVAVDRIVNAAVVRWTETGSPTGDPTEREDPDDAVVDVKWIDAAVSSACVADVPWLSYDIDAHNVDTGTHPVTISWFADADQDGVPDGPAVRVDTIPAGGDLSGRMLWPGAAVDDAGIGVGWPGWRPVHAGETPVWENMIDDPTLPEAPLRAGALVRIEVNPVLSVDQTYPASTPRCEVARTPTLTIDKVASTAAATAGDPVDYTLAVAATGYGATDDVTVTDAVPAALKVTGVTTAAPTDPSQAGWRECTVTDRRADGYGGTVTCVLDGWIGHGQSAPAITVRTVLSPDAGSGSVVNTASVRWTDPDAGGGVLAAADSADASAPVQVSSVLAATGATVARVLLAALVLIGLGLLVVRGRRRVGRGARHAA
ncbi:hypothetical protein AGMMS50218_03360 [Actinomycetota bacterium]|nr:hypothetical protein AGMMS50218_03360 [Actinomycetota bacterium]